MSSWSWLRWFRPKPPTPPVPLPLRTVAVIVRDTAGANVDHARVELDDVPRSHVGFTVDGLVTFAGVPASLVQSHLWVSAEDYVPVSVSLPLPSTDVQVWLGGEPDQPTAIRLPALEPDHVDPSEIPLTTLAQFRGGMWVNRAAIPYGPRPSQADNINAMDNYQWYGSDDRALMRTNYRAQGYTHAVTGPMIGEGYHGQYPSSPNPLTQDWWDWYLGCMQEWWDAGIIPVHFAIPEFPGYTVDRAIAELEPFFVQERAQKLLRVIVLAWEPSPWRNADYVKAAEWLHRIFPHALFCLHTEPEHNAPGLSSEIADGSLTEAQMWANVAPYIHIFLQQTKVCFEGTDQDQADWLAMWDRAFQGSWDSRFLDGYHGWPTRSAWEDHGIWAVPAEYASYWCYWKNVPESEAQTWGDRAMQAGARGYLDGGTLPPPVTTRTVAVIVRDAADNSVNQARVELDQRPTPYVGFTVDGIVNLAVSGSLQDTQLGVTADGYVNLSEHIRLDPNVNQQMRIGAGPDPDQPNAILLPALQPVVVELPRLRVNGDVFERADGLRWTAIQCSDFNLLNRWQHGEDISLLLAQRRNAGFNMLRVWTLYDLEQYNIGVFLDIDYSRIPDFLDECARFGFYVELTAYTSLERVDHWDQLVVSVQGTGCLLELVNEGTLPVNQIDMSCYARPTGILASHGSGGSEGDPPWEPWDYITFHTNGASEEQRKVGKQAFDLAGLAGVPVLTNETSRFPDVGMWAGSDLDRCAQLAYDAARGAALLCAGSCFHSRQGKNSTLWDETAFAVASAWARGAMSMPLAAQHQPYVHRTDLETPDILRAYQRGTNNAHIALIRV